MSSATDPAIIPERSLESAIAVALKLGRFRPTRGVGDENDVVCDRAARVVVEAFRRNGWQVINPEPYGGWGPEGSAPLMRQQPPPRCESCDD